MLIALLQSCCDCISDWEQLTHTSTIKFAHTTHHPAGAPKSQVGTPTQRYTKAYTHTHTHQEEVSIPLTVATKKNGWPRAFPPIRLYIQDMHYKQERCGSYRCLARLSHARARSIPPDMFHHRLLHVGRCVVRRTLVRLHGTTCRQTRAHPFSCRIQTRANSITLLMYTRTHPVGRRPAAESEAGPLPRAG